MVLALVAVSQHGSCSISRLGSQKENCNGISDPFCSVIFE
jgi:hypothetical protein